MKSSGGQSSSPRDVSSLMQLAQTQPQTATGLMTVHCLDSSLNSCLPHTYTHTHFHTKGPSRRGLQEDTNSQHTRSADINRAVSQMEALFVLFILFYFNLFVVLSFFSVHTRVFTLIDSPVTFTHLHVKSLQHLFLLISSPCSLIHLHKLMSLRRAVDY